MSELKGNSLISNTGYRKDDILRIPDIAGEFEAGHRQNIIVKTISLI